MKRSIGKCQKYLNLGDFCDGGLVEKAAVLQLTFILLHLQLAANQSYDQRTMGEDTDDDGAVFDGPLRTAQPSVNC